MVLLILFLFAGVFPSTSKDIFVNVGELVTLRCNGYTSGTAKTILWKKENDQKTLLYSNMSASEQQKLGLIFFQTHLVILSASVKHQGNYSCSPSSGASSQMWFNLTVCSKQSQDCNFSNTYSQRCTTIENCEPSCDEKKIIAEGIPDITSYEPKWHKENVEHRTYYNLSEELQEIGVYRCTLSFLYFGQVYNASFREVLFAPVAVKNQLTLGIKVPRDGQVFVVELGATVVISCRAVIGSCDDSLLWFRENDFVETTDDNNKFRVFYNNTCEDKSKIRHMNASLVFREVLEEDLHTNFSCKLESVAFSQFVTITLKKKVGPSYFILTMCTVCIVVLITVTVVTYVKFRIDVMLFLRDKFGFKGCQSYTSDGKSYDAFLMCYKSSFDGGLNEDDIKYLINTLEDQFGYSLCLYDRDVLPGQAVADAVLECVEQSRAVVLVPSLPDPEPGNGVLSAIHASLVEQKTHLIIINSEQTEASTSGSFQDALELLSKIGDSVTWKGRPSSSHFWKQLRYHLPAPQEVPKMQLLPQKDSRL
ncbi:X-linked interleukin-1 receptor accessory protein-like 2 [Cyprinodon tularosa]|uniref:X-linked interleukin-1 receptor accessory protein-like 2 n=1 Tax=Cyprinodon tularosa TaxID=77115 RepID=UPI0018E22554|nr:X-linked interleukin-1 receptor accessory protein-like 2 [Cyprinodon tularosa]